MQISLGGSLQVLEKWKIFWLGYEFINNYYICLKTKSIWLVYKTKLGIGILKKLLLSRNSYPIQKIVLEKENIFKMCRQPSQTATFTLKLQRQFLDNQRTELTYLPHVRSIHAIDIFKINFDSSIRAETRSFWYLVFRENSFSRMRNWRRFYT